jgi:hypothetical protein
MAWKDKNGRALENEDTVIVEGKISGRHSSDRISVTVAPGQSVLIDSTICKKGKSKPEPEPKAEKAKVIEGPESEATDGGGDEDAPL